MPVRGRPRGFDREEALERALELFWAKGYEQTSISDLTQAMGLKPPSLYAAFGSKEALFQEALALYTRTRGDGIWDALENVPTARAAVEEVLRRTALAYSSGETPRGCMVVLAAPQPDGASPGVCEALKARRSETGRMFQDRLERAVAEGELPEQTDCAAMAAYYMTVQHGLSIQARDGASRETMLSVVDCAMAAWEQLTSPGSGKNGAGNA